MIIVDKDTFLTTTVSDSPNYRSRVNILGVVLNMTCEYNTRNGLRSIILTDQNNRPLLPQTYLKKGKICEFNHLANQYNLSFSVTLRQKDKTKVIANDYDYLNWASDFDLYFIGRKQSTEDAYRINIRKVYVGN